MSVDELQLLYGFPIEIGDIAVEPLTMKDIMKLKEPTYWKYVNMLTLNKDSFEVVDEEITIFDLVFTFCLKEDDFRDIFLKSLSCFLREEIKLHANNDNYFFYIENEEKCSFITRYNYEDIIEVIKLQNCLVKKEDDSDKDNPADEKARQILERQKRARELLAKAKKSNDEGEPLTLSDLVSILASNGNGITPFNVWDLHFYMFNNQFNRMRMLEEYDVSIRSLLAGAKSEEVNLKHWMSKIK